MNSTLKISLKTLKLLMYNNLEKLYNGVTGSHGWNLEKPGETR
jgi:hypothetical protein